MNNLPRRPRHVAVIMDGNGRWAQRHGLERYRGHMEGVESVRSAIRASVRCGVEYLTLYAFSSENWGRPRQEVDALMELFCRSVENEAPELIREGVKVLVIGRRERFPERVRADLDRIERLTADGQRLTLMLALNYSSRTEIADAARRLARKAASGEIDPEQIDEQAVAEQLYTYPCPDPDLIIRTSGECRLSNFLLWQASYAEFCFVQTLWPDFGEKEFENALAEYAERKRRFGLVNTQDATKTDE